MDTAILLIEDLLKKFDGVVAVKDFNVKIREKKIYALIGPNGAGKTTLFDLISGHLRSDNGTIIFKNEIVNNRAPHIITRKGIGRTFQELRFIQNMTVIENVMFCFKNQKGENILEALLGRDRFDFDFYKNKALEILNSLHIADKAENPAYELSYGQQKLLSLACCLALEPDLLLLDEPTAGVNPEIINTILDLMLAQRDIGKTILLIEHNMDVVMNICDYVIFMDNGHKLAEGDPGTVRNDPKIIKAYLD